MIDKIILLILAILFGVCCYFNGRTHGIIECRNEQLTQMTYEVGR